MGICQTFSQTFLNLLGCLGYMSNPSDKPSQVFWDVWGIYQTLLTNLLKQPRLKEAEEARTLCVSIEGLECANDMVIALQQHATAMTNLFRELSKLTSQKVDSEESYASLFALADSYSGWYKSRRKVANSMKSAAGSSGTAAWLLGYRVNLWKGSFGRFFNLSFKGLMQSLKQ